MKKYILLFVEEITFLYFMHLICMRYPERFTGNKNVLAFYVIFGGTIGFSWLICRIMSWNRLQKSNRWLVRALTLFAMNVVNFMLFFVLSNHFGYYASIKTLLLTTMMLALGYRLIDISVMNEEYICKSLESDDELDEDYTDACEKHTS